DVAGDVGLRLQLDALAGAHRALDRAVRDDVRHGDVADDHGVLAQDQGAVAFALRGHVPLELAVDAQAPRERDVAFELRARAAQGVDRIARLLVAALAERA